MAFIIKILVLLIPDKLPDKLVDKQTDKTRKPYRSQFSRALLEVQQHFYNRLYVSMMFTTTNVCHSGIKTHR